MLIFSFLTVTYVLAARQPHVSDTTFQNFTVSNGKILWSRVYENVSKDDVLKYFSNGRYFVMNQTTDSVIVGFTRSEVLPIYDCGYKPSAIVHPLDDQCEVSFRIDLAENRYRVVVDCVKWSNVYSVGIPTGGIIIGASGTETHTLEEIAFKKDRFRKFFIKKGAAQLNNTFTYMFTVKFPENIIPDKW